MADTSLSHSATAKTLRRTPRAAVGAFTLIELLVVIAIVGVLLAILVPNLRSARTQARRTLCATHLRQIGVAMGGYLSDNNDRFPHASFMPSALPPEDARYIADVLAGYVDNNEKVWQCPEDVAGRTDRPAPWTGMSYYQSERSSYEYRTRPRIAGRTMDEIANRLQLFLGDPAPENTIWVMRDYNNFHTATKRRTSDDEDEGKSEPGQRNYLYSDGHVADYEKY